MPKVYQTEPLEYKLKTIVPGFPDSQYAVRSKDVIETPQQALQWLIGKEKLQQRYVTAGTGSDVVLVVSGAVATAAILAATGGSAAIVAAAAAAAEGVAAGTAATVVSASVGGTVGGGIGAARGLARKRFGNPISKGARGMKAGWKTIRGTKGEHRKQAARVFLEGAGDSVAEDWKHEGYRISIGVLGIFYQGEKYQAVVNAAKADSARRLVPGGTSSSGFALAIEELADLFKS